MSSVLLPRFRFILLVTRGASPSSTAARGPRAGRTLFVGVGRRPEVQLVSSGARHLLHAGLFTFLSRVTGRAAVEARHFRRGVKHRHESRESGIIRSRLSVDERRRRRTIREMIRRVRTRIMYVWGHGPSRRGRAGRWRRRARAGVWGRAPRSRAARPAPYAVQFGYGTQLLHRTERHTQFP